MKNSRLKKVLSLLLVTVMAFNLGGFTAFAADEPEPMDDSKQRVIDMHPDGVKANIYLYYHNEVPADINQYFNAGSFGPRGDNTPYFEVTVDIETLLADPNITVQWDNVDDFYMWYVSVDSPGTEYTTEQLWSKILDCMSPEDQGKFSAIGVGTYMGYVLKNEGVPHIDGVLNVELPYYRTELYIDGKFVKDLEAESDDVHTEAVVKDEFLALLKEKYGDDSLTVEWETLTFTSKGIPYTLKLNDAYGTDGVGFQDDGKQNYERQNGVDFYLACQYIDIDTDSYAAPHGEKIVSGLASLPDDYQAALELRGPNGTAIATAALAAEDFEKQEDGTFIADFWFDASTGEDSTPSAPGTLGLPAGTYTVVETSASSISGMKLAAPAYALTILDSGETPAPVATNQIPVGVDGEDSVYRFTVTNAYSATSSPPVDPNPDPVKVDIAAAKTLNGAAPGNNAFTFYLKDEGGSIVQTKQNGGDGTVTFDGLSFDRAGTYSYTLVEAVGSNAAIRYDAAAYTVTIEVTQEGDTLAAKVSYLKNGAAYTGIPAFANTTTPVAPDDDDDDDDDETGVTKVPTITLPDEPVPLGSGPSDGTTDLTVNKVWQDGGSSQRPTQAWVQLYQNGKAYGDPVSLNSGNGWKHTWQGLDNTYSWMVDEPNVPSGYVKTIYNAGTSVTITNSKPLDKVPKTGDESNTRLLAILVALSLAGMGVTASLLYKQRPRKAGQK